MAADLVIKAYNKLESARKGGNGGTSGGKKPNIAGMSSTPKGSVVTNMPKK